MKNVPTIRASQSHRDEPQVREQLITELRRFHQYYAAHRDPAELLEGYCEAVCAWVKNPNTSLYSIDMLLDEISVAVQGEE